MRSRHGDTIQAPEAVPDARQPAAADLRSRLDRLSMLHPSSADYADNAWERAKVRCTEAWQHHQDRWPRPDCKPARPELPRSVERAFADCCAMIEAAEQSITGRLRGIEAQHPGGVLAGLEFSLKRKDRIIEKAAEYLDEMPGITPAQAFAMVPDAVRYTFVHEAGSYADGVHSKMEQIKADGFEMLKLKNLWHHQEYNGVNSQWYDSATGQRFEVQFHTAISFEAKQLTHGAYERIRDPSSMPDRRELGQLHDIQREITAQIPRPPGVDEVRDQG